MKRRSASVSLAELRRFPLALLVSIRLGGEAMLDDLVGSDRAKVNRSRQPPEKPRGIREVETAGIEPACCSRQIEDDRAAAQEDAYWCSWILRNGTGKCCGYIQRGPGNCPFDHGEDVPLVPLLKDLYGPSH